MKTLEKGVNYPQNLQYDITLLSLLLTLNIFCTFFLCFCCWAWASKCLLGTIIQEHLSKLHEYVPKNQGFEDINPKQKNRAPSYTQLHPIIPPNMTSFWCLYTKLWTYFYDILNIFEHFSIVDFEQVNVCWDGIIHYRNHFLSFVI